MLNIDKPRLPGPRDRIAIIGPTGSGKTHAALWHLGNASFLSRPYLVINPKREELLEGIERITPMDVTDDIPKYPGLYDIQPLPRDADLVQDLLIRAWDNENVGIWIDEGLMFGDGEGVEAILTQGRSKKCPCIFLMQRPVWVSRFAVSEATFVQYFGLSDKRDRATVKSFAENLPVDEPLGKFHSFYYDIPRKKNFLFKPMPDAATILDTINSRMDTLKPQRKVI